MSHEHAPVAVPGATPEILYVDNHVIAVVKPAGVPSVPDETRAESMFDRVREWIRVSHAKPGNVYLGVVHRLDRPVSGVLVFARTSKAAARLSEQFRIGDSEKTYWAICTGRPEAREGRVEHWLAKRADVNLVAAHAHQVTGGRLAKTRWCLLGTSADGTTSWVELHPETGRPHQLRVAMASLGHPLLGDVKYGAKRRLPDRSIGLHARRLVLAHPTRAESLELVCAPPDTAWWRTALGSRGPEAKPTV